MKPATTNNQTGQQNALPKKKRSKRSNARKNRDKKDKKILSTSNITVRIYVKTLLLRFQDY